MERIGFEAIGLEIKKMITEISTRWTDPNLYNLIRRINGIIVVK